jgi:hypothetical protein
MTILIYETAGSSNFMTLFKDSSDPKLFYFVPKFSELATFPSTGKLKFGSRLFRRSPTDPADGFAIYNFSVSGVIPNAELIKVKAELESTYGAGIRISAITPDIRAPSLIPLTDGIYTSIKCQSVGVDLFADLACSFTVPEDIANDVKELFREPVGWAGQIDFTVRTKKTSFDWKITANWHRVQEHFKSQLSVKYWFVSSNISYETQRLIENGTIHIDITGGSPSQKEKVYGFAEKIAQRLFVPTLQPGPMANHPSGAAVCFSLSYSRVEEDRTSVWSGSERDYEDKPLGIAALIGSVPESYFSGYDLSILTGDPIKDSWIRGYTTDEELAAFKAAKEV